MKTLKEVDKKAMRDRFIEDRAWANITRAMLTHFVVTQLMLLLGSLFGALENPLSASSAVVIGLLSLSSVPFWFFYVMVYDRGDLLYDRWNESWDLDVIQQKLGKNTRSPEVSADQEGSLRWCTEALTRHRQTLTRYGLLTLSLLYIVAAWFVAYCFFAFKEESRVDVIHLVLFIIFYMILLWWYCQYMRGKIRRGASLDGGKMERMTLDKFEYRFMTPGLLGVSLPFYAGWVLVSPGASFPCAFWVLTAGVVVFFILSRCVTMRHWRHAAYVLALLCGIVVHFLARSECPALSPALFAIFIGCIVGSVKAWKFIGNIEKEDLRKLYFRMLPEENNKCPSEVYSEHYRAVLYTLMGMYIALPGALYLALPQFVRAYALMIPLGTVLICLWLFLVPEEYNRNIQSRASRFQWAVSLLLFPLILPLLPGDPFAFVHAKNPSLEAGATFLGVGVSMLVGVLVWTKGFSSGRRIPKDEATRLRYSTQVVLLCAVCLLSAIMAADSLGGHYAELPLISRVYLLTFLISFVASGGLLAHCSIKHV